MLLSQKYFNLLSYEVGRFHKVSLVLQTFPFEYGTVGNVSFVVYCNIVYEADRMGHIKVAHSIMPIPSLSSLINMLKEIRTGNKLHVICFWKLTPYPCPCSVRIDLLRLKDI